MGWVCACGRRLVDAAGTTVGGDATGRASCPACPARYDIDGDLCVAVATASTTEAPA
jgi:hypothetical protein